MQDLLQGLQNAREIIASGPVVMAELQRILTNPETTPLQRMMILRNITFRVTQRAPDDNQRRRGNRMEFNFDPYTPIRTRINYV